MIMKNFIGRADAAKMAGFCTKLIPELIKNDGFPKPIVIGRSNKWVDTEIQTWIEHKIAERDLPSIEVVS